MTAIYRPRKPSTKGFLLAMTPLLLLALVSALSDTRDLIRISEGLAIFFVPFVTFILIGFNFTYVALNGHTIKVVKFVVIRNNIDITKIKSLKYRAFGTVSLDGINIEYVNSLGFRRKAILGSIGAYGQKQIAAIVKSIITINPTVHIDERTKSLV
jgi:hypothetical protein